MKIAIKPVHIFYGVLSSIGTIVIVVIIWLLFFRSTSVIPNKIHDQLDFTPFVAVSGEGYVATTDNYSYDPYTQVLRFTITTASTGKLTVSQQTTPQQFIDIADYFSKLVDSLNRYSAFDNSYGTVYLTQPTTLPKGQMAIMNASGVLVFVSSTKDLSDDQWRQVFQHLKLDR